MVVAGLIVATIFAGIACGALGRRGTKHARVVAYLIAFGVGWLVGRYWPH